MDMSQVFYNQERQIYEVKAPAGKAATYFVFPPTLQTGDKLPALYIHAWEQDVLFKFDGEYNAETDNLEFFIEGPIGYVYKISLQIDLPEQTYAWKIKRHGHTNIGRDNGATRLFVPRALCLRPQTLIESEQEVVKRWSFYGQAVPQQFGRLRLKVAFFPARCAENPDNNYPRGSKGLDAYFDKSQPVAQPQHEHPDQGAGQPKHQHKAPSPMRGYSRGAEALPSPKEEPGPPTHLASSRLGPDSAKMSSKRQAQQKQCCCFLVDLSHEHNGTCGNHIHRPFGTSSVQVSAASEVDTNASTSTINQSLDGEVLEGARSTGSWSAPTTTSTETTGAAKATGVGCDDAFDIACLQDDDGLKLLDDSVTLNPLDSIAGMCCARDASFGSAASAGSMLPVPSSVEECGAKIIEETNNLCAAAGAGVSASANAPPDGPVSFERKVDLARHTSIAERFPPKIRNLLTSAASRVACADIPCPRSPGCACTGLKEKEEEEEGAGPRRPTRVTKNYNQNFAFAKIKVACQEEPRPDAEKPLLCYQNVAERAAGSCVENVTSASSSIKSCPIRNPLCSCGRGPTGKDGKCIHVHVKDDKSEGASSRTGDSEGVIKIEIPR